MEITGDHLSLSTILEIATRFPMLSLSETCKDRIRQSRDCLDSATRGNGETWYGVNTGFGSLYNVRISDDATGRLQHNLVRSHAAGAGPLVPYQIARLTLLLKILSLCPGNSGVRPELVERLLGIWNAGLAPAMYMFGSLGASGDLAPLAHLALLLTGEGECLGGDHQIIASEAALQEHGIEPLALKSKEGLALINGTQFSSAYGIWAVSRGNTLMRLANICAAMSLDGYNGNPQPFDPRIHGIRPHAGQREVARQVLGFLSQSEIASQGEKQLQDPYAFRCVPQVHGATWDVLQHCASLLETEANSVTDNPLVFPETGEILSGGNFHGQPVALAMDYLALAIAELGSISERRTYQLLCGTRGLPDYLTMEAGVQSGLMIAQYTAASVVNRNKMLCTPASIDSIPTSKGQEDHVSMSANAASKLYEICDNLHTILSIEFLTAARALEFRKPARTSPYLQELIAGFRKEVPMNDEDEAIAPLILKTRAYTEQWMDTGIKGSIV